MRGAEVPVAEGATLEDALTGGEEAELVETGLQGLALRPGRARQGDGPRGRGVGRPRHADLCDGGSVIGSANGELKANGKIEVNVRGLVIDPNDPAAIAAGRAGTNPSPSFIAIVRCLSKDAVGAATTVNVQTKPFPATSNGNSKIEDTVSLPQPCIAPIIFVASPGGAWFAATGN